MTFSKFEYLKSLHGRELKPADYRVLVTLLDYARRDGTMAHPGSDVLATDCCMHRETVRQSLRRLCDGGYIHQTHQGGYQRGASSYRFPDYPQQSAKTVLSNESQHSQNRQKPSTQQSPQTGTSVDEQIDDEKPSSNHGVEDPWGATNELARGASKVQPSERDGAGLGSGSLRSPGYPIPEEPSSSPVIVKRVDSRSGTPQNVPPRAGDFWPESVDAAPCTVCGQPVYRDDDYEFSGYAKWHSTCAATSVG